jgi:hypothetical protein
MVSNKAIRQAIYQKLNTASVTNLLSGGSAGINHAVAGPTAAYPLLVFSKSSGTQVNAFRDEAYKTTLWLIKGIARGKSASAAEDIDKAVFDLLDHGTLTIAGAVKLAVYRESDVEFAETQGDEIYHHCGGLYRVAYQDT